MFFARPSYIYDSYNNLWSILLVSNHNEWFNKKLKGQIFLIKKYANFLWEIDE
jgi:hypothetical protein